MELSDIMIGYFDSGVHPNFPIRSTQMILKVNNRSFYIRTDVGLERELESDIVRGTESFSTI